MYAIIEDSGLQIKAQVGATLTIDLRDLGANAKTVTFDKVLLIGGEKSKVGSPYVQGASVAAEIVDAEFKDQKLDIFKYKRRKGSRTKQGHRQRYMKVKVTSINA